MDNRVFTPHFVEIDSFEKLKAAPTSLFMLPEGQLVPQSVPVLKMRDLDKQRIEDESGSRNLRGNQRLRTIIQKRIRMNRLTGSNKKFADSGQGTDNLETRKVEIRHNQEEVNSIVDMYNLATFKVLILVDFTRKYRRDASSRLVDYLRHKNGSLVSLDSLVKRSPEARAVLCIVTDAKYLRENWQQLRTISCKAKNIFLLEDEVSLAEDAHSSVGS